MSSIAIFCLGIAVAITIIFVIVVVVVMVRLNNKIKKQEGSISEVSQNVDNDRRNASLENGETRKQLFEEKEYLERKILDSLVDAKSYTDSRIDKALGIKRGGVDGKAGITE